MRRTATDILKRGFNNALANWPLILIRIAESIVYIGIIVAAAFAVIIPFIVSLGVNRDSLNGWRDDPGFLLDLVAAHWLALVWMFVVASIVLLLITAIHSFVASGCVQVYVDGERRTAAMPDPPRDAFRSFTSDRWMQGGKGGWWTVFWIYNIAWSVGALIMLVPLMIVMVVMFVLRDAGAAAVVAVGCGGALLSLMLIIVVSIVTNIWSSKAIADAISRNLGASIALSAAWREVRTDFGRHLAVAIVMMAVALAGSMALSSVSWVGNINHDAGLSLALMPVQFASSIANTLFSTAVGAWFLASFAGLAIDSRA